MQVTFPVTLTDPNPVLKVAAFLKSNIRISLKDKKKDSIEH